METINTDVKRGMGRITNASQALAILEPIPAKKWLEGALGSFEKGQEGMSCALGHMNRFVNTEGLLEGTENIKVNMSCYFGDMEEDSCHDLSGLDIIASKYLRDKGLPNLGNNPIPTINDDMKNPYGYKQKTPRARVLAFVRDMVKAGY